MMAASATRGAILEPLLIAAADRRISTGLVVRTSLMPRSRYRERGVPYHKLPLDNLEECVLRLASQLSTSEEFNMEFTIIHRGDGMWEVHRTGCQDIAKTMRSANGAITRHADNVDAAIHDDLHVDNGGELADLGYDEGYYHVKPCAHTGAGK